MVVKIQCNKCKKIVEVNIDTEGGTIITASDDNIFGNLKLIICSDGSQYIRILCNECK